MKKNTMKTIECVILNNSSEVRCFHINNCYCYSYSYNMWFLIWYKNNPYIIVVPADDLDDVTDRARNNLDPSYGVVFDKNKVDFVNVKKYREVYNLLRKYFYEEVDENVLLEGSIAGMANSLQDPYTVYFTKDQMALFMERSRGSYVGIGVTVNMPEDGILTVVEPFEDSPAIEAGIKMGDKIVKLMVKMLHHKGFGYDCKYDKR